MPRSKLASLKHNARRRKKTFGWLESATKRNNGVSKVSSSALTKRRSLQHSELALRKKNVARQKKKHVSLANGFKQSRRGWRQNVTA